MGKGANNPTIRGLTLVEMIAAAGLVSLLVLFCLGLIPSFKVSNRRANTELQAGALAQSLLEQAKATPFADVINVAAGATTGPFQPRSLDGVTYTPSQEISDMTSAGTPPTEISKNVKIIVTWKWSGRTMRTFRQTIICRIPRS